LTLLQLQDASLAFGHTPLLKNVDLVLEASERLCLIGRNGTGKSSLLNVINGTQALDSGVLRLRNGVTVAKLAQDVPAGVNETIYETVAQGLGDLAGLLLKFHKASNAVADGDDASMQRLSEIQAEIEQQDAWDASQKVDSVLTKLNLPGDALMTQCSGGMRRRAMLAQAMVREPDVLLLDEPTNHLDIASIDALEQDLKRYVGTVMFITHDRSFIDALATRIVELDRGTLRDYPGSYSAYQARKAQELEAEATHEKQADKRLAGEEEWIRQGIKARRTRNEGRVRRLKAMRKTRAERLERQGSVHMRIDTGKNSGKIVLEAESVTLSFDATPLIESFSTTILRGDRVGIIGPNGSGKSTLIKLLLGELTPQSGIVKQGTGLNIAYFDQERAQLDPQLSVRDNLSPGTDQIQIGDKTKHVMSYLKDFLFAPQRANSPVSALSGGERNRLLLAKLFSMPANLLVLDEPTNDLDVETLELLEELMESYTGTVLLVSHDRAFLDRTITSTLVMEGEGKVAEFVGGYADWQAQSRSNERGASEKHRTSEVQPTSGHKHTDPASPSHDEADRKPIPQRKKTLSYKLQRELESLPETIDALETQQTELSNVVSEASFYEQDQDTINHTLEALANLGKELEQAYDRWAELEATTQGE